MLEDRTQHPIGAILLVIVVVFIFVIALASKHSGTQSHHKKEFTKIYRADDGHYYVRCHGRGGFSFWEFNGSGDSGGGDVFFSDGGWTRVSTTPTGLTATSKVDAEENGRPTEDVEEETAATEADEITESTTESEAEGMGSSSDGGSDSAGDSGGGDGGGDGGGGDGGGGSD